MKPEASLPQISPENFGVQSGLSIENASLLDSPEKKSVMDVESYDRRAENASVNDTATAVSILPMPAPAVQVVADLTAPVFDSPLLANDDDLIEKEWVDKAKKILADTKEDPFLREKEVSKLQVDYIKKRYGRELGVAE